MEKKGFALYPPALGRFEAGQKMRLEKWCKFNKSPINTSYPRGFFEGKGVKNGSRGTL